MASYLVSDYVVEQRNLDRYVAYHAEHDDGRHALPRVATHWWRERDELSIGAGVQVAGRTGFAASVAYAAERDGPLAVEL